MQLEKRKNPRLDFGITVIHNHKRRMTKDISLNGTFIERDGLNQDTPLSTVGSEIEFSLDFPNTRRYVDVKGAVIHHGKNEDGIGIWFKKIEERSKEFIKKFVLDYL